MGVLLQVREGFLEPDIIGEWDIYGQFLRINDRVIVIIWLHYNELVMHLELGASRKNHLCECLHLMCLGHRILRYSDHDGTLTVPIIHANFTAYCVIHANLISRTRADLTRLPLKFT